jgi:HK97 family phage prohead protease
MKDKEIRSLTQTIEVRSDEDEQSNAITGYALKFNRWSEDLGGFKEIISPEALNGTDMSDVRALIDHNSSSIIGRTTAGSLSLEVDDIGLKFRCEMPNTTYAKDLMENLRNGNINQCSFAFSVDDDGDEFRYDENTDMFSRTIKKIRQLFDVSVVTYPAYRDTDVAPALRSIEQIKDDELEKEKLKLKMKLELI